MKKKDTKILNFIKHPATLTFFGCLIIAFYIGRYTPKYYTTERIALDTKQDAHGQIYYVFKKKPTYIVNPIRPSQSSLTEEKLNTYTKTNTDPPIFEEIIRESFIENGKQKTSYTKVIARYHFKYWSLLPALVAILLCWISKEPITSLLGGIITGAFLLEKYDITEAVLVPEIGTTSAAGILILYLWLLGGLLGIWSRTGAAQAFAEFMSKNFVTGPRSAKLVAWGLGVIFFQGGTVSTVLVGTSVKALADEQNISHEELAYIVDSTASPIASQLAFNAWPSYIQAFIYVAGVSWLATETDRITFFFKSVPFCFYAIFAVLGTFLLSIEKAPFLGKQLRAAIERSRKTGQLDAPDAEPLSAKELQASNVPEGYKPNVLEFFVPLFALIFTAVGTFVVLGTPKVRWAFGIALTISFFTALIRGMSLKNVMEGLGDGLKGVVVGSVILLLAMTIGQISKSAGGGIYLVELLGNQLPYWTLPVLLQILTIIIAFSTGTSWGTYAVAFPLAMPLAWAVAQSQGLAHPEFYMTICFAAVMDGSVFGDQCSPISDTTVLSAMCTGCDLMDHVKTQIPQAGVAAILAGIAWTATVILFA